jgi:hypothetical protein
VFTSLTVRVDELRRDESGGVISCTDFAPNTVVEAMLTRTLAGMCLAGRNQSRDGCSLARRDVRGLTELCPPVRREIAPFLQGTHDGTLQLPIGKAACYTNLAAALAH